MHDVLISKVKSRNLLTECVLMKYLVTGTRSRNAACNGVSVERLYLLEVLLGNALVFSFCHGQMVWII